MNAVPGARALRTRGRGGTPAWPPVAPATRAVLVVLGALVVLAGGALPAAAQGPELIKVATVAPEGSTWMQVLRAYEAAVVAESDGRLQVRIFPGGVAGSEADMLRKMQFGQLDALALSGAGLGLLVPQERIFDSALLFENYAELDAIYEAFAPELEQQFRERGYQVLGWTELGPIYLFSTRPVATLEELRQLRWWVWEGDPLARAIFDAFGVAPVPLHVADVLVGLQTGVIDGVYGPPLGLIALQWFSRVDYRLDLALGHASGALIMGSRWAKLDPELQGILLRNGRRFMVELRDLSRADNAAALATLERRGVGTVKPAPEAAARLRERGAVARRSLAPELYPVELLERVESAVAAVRAAER
jgi:TRAP-type C4-dicarboxylate transport system substrate-binding protein